MKRRVGILGRGRRKTRVNRSWGGAGKERGGIRLETKRKDIPQKEGLKRLEEEIFKDSNQVGS